MTVVLASIAFWAYGTLTLPGDLGEKVQIKFKARFRRLKTSERRHLNERLLAREITDAQFLDETLLDWELHDARGDVVIYTPAVRAELVEDWDGLEAALVRSYFAVFTEGAAEKNSEAPSATT